MGPISEVTCFNGLAQFLPGSFACEINEQSLYIVVQKHSGLSKVTHDV